MHNVSMTRQRNLNLSQQASGYLKLKKKKKKSNKRNNQNSKDKRQDYNMK